MATSKKQFTVTLIASNSVLGYFGVWGANTSIVPITIEEFNDRKYHFVIAKF